MLCSQNTWLRGYVKHGGEQRWEDGEGRVDEVKKHNRLSLQVFYVSPSHQPVLLGVGISVKCSLSS